MIKKLSIILIIILSASSAFLNVSSYTSAEVKNAAGIQICDSENALIGIPEYIEDINLVQGGSSEIEVNIRNNMSGCIQIVGAYGSGEDIEIGLKQAVSVSAGGTASIPLEVNSGSTAVIGNNSVDVVYEIIWDGGSAEIKEEICVNISEPVVIQSSTQSVILGKRSFVEIEMLNNKNTKLNVLGVKFLGGSEIDTDISGIEIKDGKILLPIRVTSLEPNLYEIPVLFTVEVDGCETIIESELFLDIISESIEPQATGDENINITGNVNNADNAGTEVQQLNEAVDESNPSN